MTSQQVVDYLELIATQSKDIQHNTNGKHKFGYYEDISMEAQKNLDIRDFCLLIYKSVLTEKLSNNGQEQYFVRLPVQFEITKSIPSVDSFNDIQSAQIEAKVICKKLWRRILYDARNRNHIFSLGIVRLENNFDFEEIEGDFENMCGCAIKFTLKWQEFGIDDDYDLTTDFTI